jgi:hypothetical protein
MKTVRNTTTLEQQVLVGPNIYTLAAYEEKPFSDLVANTFLAELPEIIKEVKGDSIGAVYDKPLEKPETVWVANFMGDPDAPDKTKIKVYDKETRRYKWIEVDNPLRIPRPVSRELGGAMEEYRDAEGGLLAKNKPPTTITVPPFQRREMPGPIGRWFLTRDGNILPDQFRGQVQLSRAPSSFEPNMNWELDDMRAYLHMMDRKAKLGPCQKDVEEQYKDKSSLELAIHEAKLLCMKRLHFRVAKASARLYSRSEFEEFRRGFEKPAPSVSAEQAAAAVAKNLAPRSSSASI